MLKTLAILVHLATASAAPKHHVVTGVYPRVQLTYAPWVNLDLSYPIVDGKLTSYLEHFRVDGSPLVFDLADRGEAMNLEVTIERDGETGPWRLTKIAPQPTTRL